MSQYQDSILPLYFGLMAVFSCLVLALMQRTFFGLLALLAIPAYLLLYSSTQIHHHEFFRPKKGWQKLLSDTCGSVLSVIFFETGRLILQAVLAGVSNPIALLEHLRSSIPVILVWVMYVSLGIVVWLCWNKKEDEANPNDEKPGNWLDKMLGIKLPPPLDQL